MLSSLATVLHLLSETIYGGQEVVVSLLLFGQEAEDVDVLGRRTARHLQGLPGVWGALEGLFSPPTPLLNGLMHLHKHAHLPVDKQ